MIEVKMARNLTRDGVEGVRWVLLDPMDAMPGERGAAAAAVAAAGGRPVAPAQAGTLSAETRAALLGAAPTPAGDGLAEARATAPRQMWMLAALKTLVLLVALAAAVATAWRVIGPPRGLGADTGAAPSGAAARPAPPAPPPASAPTITALRAEPDR